MSVWEGRIREGFLEEVIQEAKRGTLRSLQAESAQERETLSSTFTPDCEFPISCQP